ncbi:MAG: histone [Nanoarchaeota archaeon]|nr:histone [Nanoarchaeota archaeon]
MSGKRASLPLAPVEKIIRAGSGANRVSSGATKTLANVLTEIALKISERATFLAKHAGRKTIKAEDINLASKEI